MSSAVNQPPCKPKPNLTAQDRKSLLHPRVEMLPHHGATGLDVKFNDQPFAACCVCADWYYSSLTRHRVLVHFAGFYSLLRRNGEHVSRHRQRSQGFWISPPGLCPPRKQLFPCGTRLPRPQRGEDRLADHSVDRGRLRLLVTV